MIKIGDLIRKISAPGDSQAKRNWRNEVRSAMEIPLTQGKVAKIDFADADLVTPFRWYARRTWKGIFYAVRQAPRADGKRQTILMHRVILGVPDGVKVDHANGDGLDNRRENLRPATSAQNLQNRHRLQSHNTTGFKGIYFNKHRQKWLAQIQHQHRRISLGYFSTPEEAAKAYDDAATRLFGKFAATNALIRNTGKEKLCS